MTMRVAVHPALQIVSTIQPDNPSVRMARVTPRVFMGGAPVVAVEGFGGGAALGPN
jgi:hypothetical protein